MSNILFDVNVPRSVSGFLTGHSVAFGDQRSWRELAGDFHLRANPFYPILWTSGFLDCALTNVLKAMS